MKRIKFSNLYQKLLHSITLSKNRCWIWNRSVSGDYNKYGNLLWKGKVIKAHRASYEVFNGVIPEGYHIHHRCRNTLCINPVHLEALPSDYHNHMLKKPNHNVTFQALEHRLKVRNNLWK